MEETVEIASILDQETYDSIHQLFDLLDIHNRNHYTTLYVTTGWWDGVRRRVELTRGAATLLQEMCRKYLETA